MLTKFPLKAIFSLFSLMFLLSLSACSTQPETTDSTGQAIHLGDYKGKWIILNYWATWCKPCYEEIPQLNQFYENHRDQAVILGINFDRLPAEQLQEFALDQSVAYPLVVDDLANHFNIGNVATLPATFVISPQGEVVATLYGPQTEASLAAAMALGTAS